jgi:hypothetical protein
MIYTARSAKYRQYLNRVEDRSFAPHTFIAYVRGDDSFWVGGGKAEQRDIGTIRLRTDNKVMTVAFAQLMQMKNEKIRRARRAFRGDRERQLHAMQLEGVVFFDLIVKGESRTYRAQLLYPSNDIIKFDGPDIRGVSVTGITAIHMEHVERLAEITVGENLIAVHDDDGTIRGIASKKMSKTCSVCGQPGARKCARCLSVRYCSAKCQKYDWKEGGHQALCNTLTQEPPAGCGIDVTQIYRDPECAEP